MIWLALVLGIVIGWLIARSVRGLVRWAFARERRLMDAATAAHYAEHAKLLEEYLRTQ